MSVLEWFVLVLGWHIIGCLIITVFSMIDSKIICKAQGLEIVNPEFIWKQTHLNTFGCCVVATFFAILIPIGAVGYWFYKLCTAGRRKRND